MKTRRALSPIERMIDAATGARGTSVPVMITLRCPKCTKTKQVKAEKNDPEGTVCANVQCPECNGDNFAMPTYFDKFGQELFKE